MVSLSKNISAKFRDKQEGVTEDEVFVLAYLLGTQLFKATLAKLSIIIDVTQLSYSIRHFSSNLTS